MLFRSYQKADDLEYKKEVIWSFQKFETLPKAAEPFFADLQDPELQACVEEVRKYFRKKAGGGN